MGRASFEKLDILVILEMQQISNRGKDSRPMIRRYKYISMYISYLLEKEIYTGTRHLMKHLLIEKLKCGHFNDSQRHTVNDVI